MATRDGVGSQARPTGHARCVMAGERPRHQSISGAGLVSPAYPVGIDLPRAVVHDAEFFGGVVELEEFRDVFAAVE